MTACWRRVIQSLGPGLLGLILENFPVEEICEFCCVAKCFDEAVAHVSTIEMRTVANVDPDRERCHALWQPLVWLRFSGCKNVIAACESPDAFVHFVGLAASASSASQWEMVELFLSFNAVTLEEDEEDEAFSLGLSSLAHAVRRGALPCLASLTLHCMTGMNRPESDWSTELSVGASVGVREALRHLCEALPGRLAVHAAVEWRLDTEVLRAVLDRHPDVDLNAPAKYLGSTLAVWADAADDSDESMAVLELLLDRGADVRGGSDDVSSPLCNVVHNGAVKAVRALLDAGANPDEGRTCGPPLLMGIGVWHDGDVLCPCSWLDKTPTGQLEVDLPERRVMILKALLQAGADPLNTHACAATLTPARSVLRHLKTRASRVSTATSEHARSWAWSQRDLEREIFPPRGETTRRDAPLSRASVGPKRRGSRRDPTCGETRASQAHTRERPRLADDGDDDAPNLNPSGCAKHHLDDYRSTFTSALFDMAHLLTFAIEDRSRAQVDAKAAKRKKRTPAKRKRATAVASRTRSATRAGDPA